MDKNNKTKESSNILLEYIDRNTVYHILEHCHESYGGPFRVVKKGGVLIFTTYISSLPGGVYSNFRDKHPELCW